MEIQLTDLRNITRDSDTLRTEVTVLIDWETRIKWLVFGECNLRKMERQQRLENWWLSAYLKEGATDFEHDSGYALRLPLIAVTFGSIYNHRLRVSAVIDPQDAHDDFHVPLPGYNPLAHEDTALCPDCKERPHLIVPEGLYVPPFEDDLFALVAGKEVEIYIGQPYEKDQD